MAINKKFGAKVRKLREERRQSDRNFTLRKFAATLGITPTYLSKIERAEFPPPSAENIIKIAELLDQNPDEFLALANKKHPELDGIIQENPVEMADFLRTAKGMSADELVKLTNQLRRKKK